MIKLFIFDSVADAREFERPEPVIKNVAVPVIPPEAAAEESDEPERPARRYGKKGKKKAAKKAKPQKQAAGGKAKYDKDQIIALSQRVESGKITAQEAADELGVSKPNWYYLRKAYAGATTKRPKKAAAEEPSFDEGGDEEEQERPAMRCNACESEDHNTNDCPELPDMIVELQRKGKDSLRIAQQLRVSLATVNKYWDKDAAVAKTEEEEEIL